MAIITSAVYQTWRNVTLDAGELASVNVICPQVDKAIKNYLKRCIEQVVVTSLILDAPPTPEILITYYAPITISTLVVYQNNLANGDPSAFSSTTDDLLTLYTDYSITRDALDTSLSPGIVLKIGGIWGSQYQGYPSRLAQKLVSIPGALKLAFTGGYATIPDDIIEAACITISKLLGIRKYGSQVGFETWNGYSYSIPGVGNRITGILGSPDIAALLGPYMNYAGMLG